MYIQPNRVLINDSLYVAYDVKVYGDVVIPRGTRVLGNWVTESKPSIAAQLQLTKIFLDAQGEPISADSDVFECLDDYNNDEVENANYLYQQNKYLSTANIVRRIVKFNCKVKTLSDNDRDTLYIEILTKEIPVTLTRDFMSNVCQ